MDTTFILEHQGRRAGTRLWERIAARLIKAFNASNPALKLKFKDDDLNRWFGLKYSERYDSKENLLPGRMLSVEEAMNIHHLLREVVLLAVPGDIVELGCYEGITTMIMQRTLDGLGSDKRVHVFDSFKGLPDRTGGDEGTDFGKGMCCCGREDLVRNFQAFGLRLPEINEGWFEDTLADGLPDRVCFAHLDGDLYTSTLTGLEHLYPRLSRGAVVVVDDYCDPGVLDVNNILPGVKRACDEFLADKEERMWVLLSGCESHGYLRKL